MELEAREDSETCRARFLAATTETLFQLVALPLVATMEVRVKFQDRHRFRHRLNLPFKPKPVLKVDPREDLWEAFREPIIAISSPEDHTK